MTVNEIISLAYPGGLSNGFAICDYATGQAVYKSTSHNNQYHKYANYHLVNFTIDSSGMLEINIDTGKE